MNRLREHIEEIISLTDEEFDYIKTFFTFKNVRKNQFLVHEGDEVNFEFLTLDGIYKVFYIDGNGKEHILQFAKKDWWMTDYIGFFKEKNATMFVECLQDGAVACLTLEGREKLASEFHKMEYFFRAKLTNGYIALQQRIILLLSSTPQQRYEEFSKLYPDLISQIPKKYVAEYLGVSRETLSRLYSNNK
ncbi:MULTISPECIES: Crp/Fnr family transcriptional regulator [Chryseobacterium]|uniref:Crp/Fnr family transcriptional regulator n=1 Tax=Chryseobacterium indoltheticum TaxID=254 RepID=A0A3G6N2J3_9FLAO|nr:MULTISPECIES: Crp/Fnr family transcriptional regulator [Chryseobacterium]AZA59726.1 Crp/Fnr family transcriptional regulator [Chryseobacterium indoltheticum]MDQ8140879.1 Crp/Fnr family transcriptional regulator [Chryseobacterium sp. CFS15]